MKFQQKIISTIGLYMILFISPIFGQLVPQEVIGSMMRGINIGNTLEPPSEGGWNNGPLQKYYFEDYEKAGFQCVRVPVRWDKHTSNNPPYKIDESWLDRVEQVIDWGLERNLFIIMNAHHEDWFFEDYDAGSARFDSIWSQIATRFQDKSDSLFFEMVNEPTVEGDVGPSVDEINELNNRLISIIRKTNPTRIIIYSGNVWSNWEHLRDAAIPKDDYIMAYYHSYDPYEFGILGTGSLNTDDIQNIKNKFKSAGDWSKENNIPVMISEFGAPVQCDYNDRMYFYSLYVEEAQKNGIAFQAWDDGGYFRIYKRSSRQWEDHKDILIYGGPNSPTNLICTPKDSTVSISWMNRTTENDSIIIERKNEVGIFQKIRKISSDAYSFTETELAPGDYYYRVIAEFADTTNMHSYPIMTTVKPSARWTYYDKPMTIPGHIEAEEFDFGGEGLTYHDVDEGNKGSASDFRSTSVDIYNCSDIDSGYHVGSIKSGEWLEYTVQVETEGEYQFEARVTSNKDTGKLNLRMDGKIILRSFGIDNTGGWKNWQTIGAKTRSLDAGLHRLRIEITGDNFYLNWFNFSKCTGIDIDIQEATTFQLNQNYPNPFNPTTTIQYSLAKNGFVILNIYKLNGALIKNIINEKQDIGNHEINFDASDLSSGVYFYTLESDGMTLTRKMILMK